MLHTKHEVQHHTGRAPMWAGPWLALARLLTRVVSYLGRASRAPAHTGALLLEKDLSGAQMLVSGPAGQRSGGWPSEAPELPCFMLCPKHPLLISTNSQVIQIPRWLQGSLAQHKGICTCVVPGQ